MKTTILTLTALGAAGLLYAAAAQDNATPATDQPAPPPATEPATQPADAGNAATAPQPAADANAPQTDQMPPPPAQDAQPGDNTGNAAPTTAVILPSQPLGCLLYTSPSPRD